MSNKKHVSAWTGWVPGKVYDVEFEGNKFKAIHLNGQIHIGGTDLSASRSEWYGQQVHAAHTVYRTELSGDQSCAYHRLFPKATEKQLHYFKWYVQNVPLKRGTTCYLTSYDGPLTKMLAILKGRGFRLVAKNKSIHGSYNVYLLVHPGDNSKLKKDGEVEDADSTS